ncbi:hypothetical protein EV193_11245 [Herbihabitans rhizosphaerae]|uniref:Very-short-patch-repair endonuclease n=1 Tax=Herbihabitans rhizosphaerae TaxID=1872711 RepID=A0A4Q7KEB6_9PSEU|nr:hypothetical protein EV193_11245 [Herbihabitans rhizosphaerae]
MYTTPDQPITHEVLCHAASMISPPGTMLTGCSAAVVYGLDMADAASPVELVVPEKERFGPVRGLRIHRGPVRLCEAVAWREISIATPARMALDLMLRSAPRTKTLTGRLRAAVAYVDQVLRKGLVTEDQLSRLLVGRRDWGVVLARQALTLVDARAESPPESELRVILAMDGIPAEPQYVVTHAGQFLGRLDLAYPDSLVAVEYDGRWHEDPEQMKRDEERRAALMRRGWRFVLVRHDDLSGDVSRIVAKVRDALRAAADFSPLKSAA